SFRLRRFFRKNPFNPRDPGILNVPADTWQRMTHAERTAANIGYKVYGHPGSLLRYIKHYSRITSLDLSAYWVQDDDLSYIENLCELEVLSLSGSPITGRGLAHLSKLKRLRYLNLNGTAIFTDDNFKALGDLSNLTDLSIAQTDLSSAQKDVLEDLLPR